MSARSRHQPWWLDGAERPRRMLIALTAPEVGLELMPPLMTIESPPVPEHVRREFQRVLKAISEGPAIILPTLDYDTWRGR